MNEAFLENTEQYLLCILEKNVPMDNNKAERVLRPPRHQTKALIWQ